MTEPYRPLLWVAGSRFFKDHDLMHSALLPYHGWTLITGGAPGADLIAEAHWRAMERPYIGIPARWAKYGPGGGPRRNIKIATLWKPDRLVALPGGRGTQHAINTATKEGIEVVLNGW